MIVDDRFFDDQLIDGRDDERRDDGGGGGGGGGSLPPPPPPHVDHYDVPSVDYHADHTDYIETHVNTIVDGTHADIAHGNHSDHLDNSQPHRDVVGQSHADHTDAIFESEPIGLIVSVVMESPIAEGINVVVSVEVQPQPANTIQIPIRINAFDKPVYPLTAITETLLTDLVSEKINNYFDSSRVLKTLLNFGDDEQQVAVAWDYYKDSPDRFKIKLLDSLRPGFENRGFELVRELADPILDTMHVRLASDVLIPELRPSSGDISTFTKSTKFIRDKKLSDLVPNITGSVSGSLISWVGNAVLENLYSSDYSSATLNIDFSDFDNFVMYGSAQGRVDGFMNKLYRIERASSNTPALVDSLNITASVSDSGSYDTIYGTMEIDDSGSVSFTGSVLYGVTGSAPNIMANTNRENSLELQNTIRSLDPFERFVWKQSSKEYSASVDYVDGTTEYVADMTYPKILGVPYSTTSSLGLAWYGDMYGVAERFDFNNVNRLRENIPSYLVDDDSSLEFMVFLDMVGHHFDNVKVYVDALTDLYTRYPSITDGLSGDLAYHVARSFGGNLPSNKSIVSLVESISGATSGSTPVADIAAEYYKRYLHALPFLQKTKGTRTSIQSLLNVFGVNPDFIKIRESDIPTTGSTQIIQESEYALNFADERYLQVPFSASLRDNLTLQMRFKPDEAVSQSVIFFDDVMRLAVSLHPSASLESQYASLGRLELFSGSDSVISTEYTTLFDGHFSDVQMTKSGSVVGLLLARGDGESVTFTSSGSGAYTSSWNDAQYLYVGRPAASSSFGYTGFEGQIDEFRLWGELVSESQFQKKVLNPGGYFGNSSNSAYNSLYVRLSFNNPIELYGTASIPNDTPYFNMNGVSDPLSSLLPDLSDIPATGFPSVAAYPYQFSRYTRTAVVESYDYSGTQFSDNFVLVHGASYTGSTTSPELSSKEALLPIHKKNRPVVTDRLEVSISPTDILDRQIARSMGTIDVGQLIGYPHDFYTEREYKDLNALAQQYGRYYHVPVSFANFIRFFDGFLDSFFEMLVDLIPARAHLDGGVVIRPTILERSKNTVRRTVRVDGANMLRTVHSVPGNCDVVYSLEGLLDIDENVGRLAEYLTYEGLLDIDENIIPLAETQDLPGKISMKTTGSFIGSYRNLQATIQPTEDFFVSSDTLLDLSDAVDMKATIPVGYNSKLVSYEGLIDTVSGYPLTIGEVPTYTAIFSAFFSQSLYSPLASPSLDNVYDIGPSARFTDMRSTTYFHQPFGVYYFDQRIRTPITTSFMPIRPTVSDWFEGIVLNQGDVVVQNDIKTELGVPLKFNGTSFVYTRVATTGDAGTVSYLPPQNDAESFTPLTYKQSIEQVAKRVALVGTLSEILSGNPRVSITNLLRTPNPTGTRVTRTLEIELTAGTDGKTLLDLGKSFIILSVKAPYNSRVRVYDSLNAQDVDFTRPSGVLPDEGHGIILDVDFTNSVVSGSAENVNILRRLNPAVQGSNHETALKNLVPITIDNESTDTRSITVEFDVFILDAAYNVPAGYLRSHYRFYRDNSIGARRRTFLGTLLTQAGTFDGRPPFESFSTIGTSLEVSPLTEPEEVTDRGNILDVT